MQQKQQYQQQELLEEEEGFLSKHHKTYAWKDSIW